MHDIRNISHWITELFVHFDFSCFLFEFLMDIMSGFSFWLRIKCMYIIFPLLLYTHCYMVATRPGPRFTRFALFRTPHSDTSLGRLAHISSRGVTSAKAGTSSLFKQRATIVIVGWFAGRTWENRDKCNTWPSEWMCFTWHIYDLQMWPWAALTQHGGSRVRHRWVIVMLSLCISRRRVEWRYSASHS
jgi:hypothetical protein